MAVAKQTTPADTEGRFAVTGAGGFIGRQLVRQLLNSGHEVVAVVRREADGIAMESLGATVRFADIGDIVKLADALEGVDGVFHLAALFNDPDKTWDDYRDVNVQGTLNVLKVAAEQHIDRVVHCSTVGVATEAELPPYSEESPYSPQPNDKYEVSKSEGEQAARDFAKKNGVSLVVIRPAQVYGPGDLSKVKFYKLVKKGIIVSPGETRKHLIYIDDLCRAFEMAMTSPSADGQVFLIAGKEPTPLSELISMAARKMQTSEPRIRLPAKPVTLACAAVESVCNSLNVKPVVFRRSMDFFTRSIECNTSKAKEVLGFQSMMSVTDGVSATVNWYEDEGLI